MFTDFAQPFAALGAYVFTVEQADSTGTPGTPSTGRNASVLDTAVQCLLEPMLVPLVGAGDG
jgi:hypothetical protein